MVDSVGLSARDCDPDESRFTTHLFRFAPPAPLPCLLLSALPLARISEEHLVATCSRPADTSAELPRSLPCCAAALACPRAARNLSYPSSSPFSRNLAALTCAESSFSRARSAQDMRSRSIVIRRLDDPEPPRCASPPIPCVLTASRRASSFSCPFCALCTQSAVLPCSSNGAAWAARGGDRLHHVPEGPSKRGFARRSAARQPGRRALKGC